MINAKEILAKIDEQITIAGNIREGSPGPVRTYGAKQRLIVLYELRKFVVQMGAL